MEYYSAIKKNKIMPFAATWMELETFILSEISQKEKDKYYTISHMWNLKYGTNEPIHKTKTDIENRLVVAKGKAGSGSGMNGEFRIGRCKLLHLEWINNKILL